MIFTMFNAKKTCESEVQTPRTDAFSGSEVKTPLYKRLMKLFKTSSPPVNRIFVENSTEKRVRFTLLNEYFTAYSMEQLFHITRTVLFDKYGYYFVKNHSFALYYRGKLLNKEFSLHNYNFSNDYNNLEVQCYALEGGDNPRILLDLESDSESDSDLSVWSEGDVPIFSDDEEPIPMPFVVAIFGEIHTVTEMSELDQLVGRLCFDRGFHDMPMIFRSGSRVNVFATLAENNFSAIYVNRLDVLFFRLQGGADEEDPAQTEFAKMFKIMDDLIRKGKYSFPAIPEREQVSDFLESVLLSYKYLHQCDTYYDWCMLTYKLFTKKSFTLAVQNRLQKLFSSEVQTDAGDILKHIRYAVDKVDEIGENKLYKKLTQAYSYLLTQGFLTRFGLELTEEEYSKIEIRTYQIAFSSKKKLYYAVFDAALFLMEKLHDYYHTGDLNVFAHGDSEYAEWVKEADHLLSLAPYTGNLEAHNTTYFEFLTRLDECIEKGEAYSKYSTAKGAIEARPLLKKINSLISVKRAELCSHSALQMRKAPFGILIAGHSSVAKSSFSQMCFYHFAKVCGLPCDDQFMYNRNPLEDHWNNFKTSMWCIRIDDAAMFKPQKMTEPDPSLKDIIGITNNVPTSPPQAALEDKGKTPVRAELLIATTNTIDLNAHEYFACPLAVQRRLPFVVNVKPKECYRHENGFFIDPARLETYEGEYPDFWDIELYEVKPHIQGREERAKLYLKKTYTDVNEFLRAYAENILVHRKNQTRAMNANAGMRDLKICGKCYSTASRCICLNVQADEEGFGEVDVIPVPNEWREFQEPTFTDTVRDIFCRFYALYCNFYIWRLKLAWNVWFLHHIMRIQVLRHFVYKALLWGLPAEHYTRVIGHLNGISLRPLIWTKRLNIFKMIIFSLGVAGAAYMVNSALKKKKSPSEELKEEWRRAATECKCSKETLKPTVMQKCTECSYVEEYEEPLGTQGNMFSTTEDQLAKEERQNVWYNPTVELAPTDLPVAAASLVGLSSAQIRDVFAANIVRIVVTSSVETDAGTQKRSRKMNAIGVTGTYFLCNSHAFYADATEYEVQIIHTPVSDGINTNITFPLKRSQIEFIPNSDVCLFQTISLPPRKNILKFWVEKEVPLSQCVEVRRTKAGYVEFSDVHKCVLQKGMYIDGLKQYADTIMGISTDSTNDGDCGAILISASPRGCFPVGMHVIGRERFLGSLFITRSTIEGLIGRIEKRQVIPLDVQGGGEPMLSLKDKIVTVGQLHHRSTLRYIADAKIKVMGSFTGFRARPRSKVCPTPYEKEFLEHYGVQQEFGAPRMGGFEPWRKNLVEMVDNVDNVDAELLHFCAQDYLDGVLDELPGDWQKELVFLSDKAAVNGLPGVQYIDGINRNSSMGAPWCSTKRNFLIPDADEKYPDGVNFGDEFWERVRHIESCWKDGRRSFPVFTGHIKDEATALRKVLINKLRIFTGAPADWSIAARKKLLPFVRLLQKNKIVFEAGPGTVCQSKEWHHFHKYLTHFGEDQMVAGDYGKYDKHMIARIIIEAFWIIAMIFEAAGFSKEECREIMCIGYDVAFSWCNFNGDLVEFLGTNPSGHPFTVIVNSIVNSLYLRYAFYSLRPKGEVVKFKEVVHLLTYGDDNVFGVSKKCLWFNHTAISKLLDTIGVIYTMADKEAVSVPFINMRDISFLKRTWRWDDDMKCYLCPLEEKSIIKSLTMWLPSTTLCKWEQMTKVILSANNEYFFYGRERFEQEHQYLLKTLQQEPLCFYAQSLPTWDELAERFQRNSDSIDEEYKFLYV